MSFFWLFFKIFPLSLIMSNLDYEGLWFSFLHVYCVWALLSFLDLRIYSSHKIWKTFSHYFFKVFCDPSPFLLPILSHLCLTLCNPMDCNPQDTSVHGDSPGKITGVGCHALLQGIFPTQGPSTSLLQLLHYKQVLYHWATRETFLFWGVSNYTHSGHLKLSYNSLMFFPL